MGTPHDRGARKGGAQGLDLDQIQLCSTASLKSMHKSMHGPAFSVHACGCLCLTIQLPQNSCTFALAQVRRRAAALKIHISPYFKGSQSRRAAAPAAYDGQDV
eukprot:1155605-Pelagomonas_calceolata.AAC.5